MPWAPGEIRCANCRRLDDEHCQTCLSCEDDPIEECCMEGWSEQAKAYERQCWAKREDGAR